MTNLPIQSAPVQRSRSMRGPDAARGGAAPSLFLQPFQPFAGVEASFIMFPAPFAGVEASFINFFVPFAANEAR
ncbi:hypothetical protein QO010_000233 [Caulobacter ginsengisoli]|uniref:Uncharacterized protein n=1 Tax=Caulobacter ginsengisoli TaxID=400775 RepID=A0ABU0IKF3_9CAUL|nr:hypothetical protein [Caulobacter ginsengisoli]MDQ0462485.1 hypothetical protein [Caulobacter ginsengisoli]